MELFIVGFVVAFFYAGWSFNAYKKRIVLTAKFGGTIEIDGEHYHIISEKDVAKYRREKK